MAEEELRLQGKDSLPRRTMARFHESRDSLPSFMAAVEEVRAKMGCAPDPPTYIQAAYSWEKIDIEDYPLNLLVNGGGSRKECILYIHGGAYLFAMGSQEWELMQNVCSSTGHDLAVFDYPLAPENCGSRAMDTAMMAYEVLTKRYKPEDVVIMGQSAGGGLAMSMCHKIRDKGLGLPSKTVLINPWLDVSVSHPEAPEIEEHDLLATVNGLSACGGFYAGDLGVKHPYISPWYETNLMGLPPIGVFTGTCDILHPEARDFVMRVVEVGGDAKLYKYEGKQHAWILGLFGKEQAEEAIADLCRFLVPEVRVSMVASSLSSALHADSHTEDNQTSSDTRQVG